MKDRTKFAIIFGALFIMVVSCSPTRVAQPSAPAHVVVTEAPAPLACWWEPKTDVGDIGPEHVCGPTRTAPSDAFGWAPYPAV